MRWVKLIRLSVLLILAIAFYFPLYGPLISPLWAKVLPGDWKGIKGEDKNKSQREAAADSKRLYRDVLAITAIQPPRDYKHRDSLNRVAEYIAGQFKQWGCWVGFQEFKAKGKSYKNVIATVGPTEGKRIILGAHYDSCGPFPGADDNASGVAVLLELARLIRQNKSKLPYGIDLVAYTLEEPPFFRTTSMGSYVHAKSLFEAGVKVKLMISVDMVGYFSAGAPIPRRIPETLRVNPRDRGNATVVSGCLKHNAIIGEITKRIQKDSPLEIISLSAPRRTATLDYSDHLNFWKFGYPALLVSNYYVSHNPNYHSPDDTIDTLDFGKMAEIVNGLYRVVLYGAY